MIVLLVAICACAFVGNQRGDAPVSPPRDKNMAPRAGASAEAAAQPVDHLGSDHLGSAEPERRRDNHTSCSAWAAAGECSSNPTFMLSQCAESCALRDLARAHDEDANCAAWAEAGECSSNPAYMHSHCSRSCGDATPQSADALLDTWHTPAECTQWAGSGEWCVRCSRTLLIRVSLRLSLSLSVPLRLCAFTPRPCTRMLTQRLPDRVSPPQREESAIYGGVLRKVVRQGHGGAPGVFGTLSAPRRVQAGARTWRDGRHV